MSNKDLAEIAYNAYGDAADWRTINTFETVRVPKNHTISAWNDTPAKIKNYWLSVVEAIREELMLNETEDFIRSDPKIQQFLDQQIEAVTDGR